MSSTAWAAFAAGQPVRVGEGAPGLKSGGRPAGVMSMSSAPPTLSARRIAGRRDFAMQTAIGSAAAMLAYSPRVADRDVRPSDREPSDRLRERQDQSDCPDSAKPPVALRAGRSHGLIYAVPGEKPGTVIVVSEGLPWWREAPGIHAQTSASCRRNSRSC